jgi:hypothetical protein
VVLGRSEPKMMVWEMAGASANKVLFLDNSTLKEDVALLFFSINVWMEHHGRVSELACRTWVEAR